MTKAGNDCLIPSLNTHTLKIIQTFIKFISQKLLKQILIQNNDKIIKDNIRNKSIKWKPVKRIL